MKKFKTDVLAAELNEFEKRNGAKELILANKELSFQIKEKMERAAELISANKELAFQNQENEKRTNELILANIELTFQIKEKLDSAAELIVANKELAYQNVEKEKRAYELIIANKELIFQNEEKEKRANELIIANKELAYQNSEKEIRAKELVEANHEIIERTAQLESVNKELESFSYSVSHDMRAPLRAIHGYAQMLKSNYESQFDTEANRLMGNIINNTKKMGQLIDELLTFSRLSRKELVLMDLSMQDMVTAVYNDLKIEHGDRNIELIVKELLPAHVDKYAIKQVWCNLFSNAIKYTKYKDKAIIEIHSYIDGNEIIYSIKDNGAGFDMLYIDKLFGVFQRLHSGIEFEGTGVGLAIVQRIIAKHEGRVWAEGKVNEGAIFYFSIPNTKIK